MELIPDLPEEIARECLIRTSYQQFPLMASVCKRWKREISLSDFFRHRKASGHSQELLVLSHYRNDVFQNIVSGRHIPTPIDQISVLDLESSLWIELPPIPGQSNGLHPGCTLTSAGSDLVVLGGFDHDIKDMSNSVFIFSFLTSTWRNGMSMPSRPGLYFAYASDSQRNVFVAGGHDVDGNALTSALMYDVLDDNWTILPELAHAREDSCTAVFHAGKFYFMGGCEQQEQISKTAESFDVATWRWGPQESDFLSSKMTTMWPSPRFAAAENGDLYACCRYALMIRRGNTWQKLGNLPADVRNIAYMAVRKSGKLLVIGSASCGKPSVWYYWDMSNTRWLKLETRQNFEGYVVNTGCFIDI